MRCKHAHQLIDASLDGLLGPRERRALEGHLNRCARCSTQCLEQRELDRSLAEALPLPVSLGDEFAARMAARMRTSQARLPAARPILRIARWKWAAIGVIMLAVAAYLLIPTRSFESQALAAIQEAMNRVQSVHYVVSPTTHARGRYYAAWATPTDSKMVSEDGWLISHQDQRYFYLRPAKTLFIIPGGDWSPGEMFAMLVDPKSITKVEHRGKPQITVEQIRYSGRRMKRVTVTADLKNLDGDERIMQRVMELVREYLPQSRKARRAAEVMRTGRVKTIYLVDTRSNLVRSVTAYGANRVGAPWHALARTSLIEYNVPLSPRLFELPPMPPGTRKVDLRRVLSVLRYVPESVVEAVGS